MFSVFSMQTKCRCVTTYDATAGRVIVRRVSSVVPPIKILCSIALARDRGRRRLFREAERFHVSLQVTQVTLTCLE